MWSELTWLIQPHKVTVIYRPWRKQTQEPGCWVPSRRQNEGYSQLNHQKAPGTGQEKGPKPTQPHENSLTRPPSQHETGNTILYPKKIYSSILLEPSKNNILQEHIHKYPTIPYIIFWNLLEHYSYFLDKATSERAKVINKRAEYIFQMVGKGQ